MVDIRLIEFADKSRRRTPFRAISSPGQRSPSLVCTGWRRRSARTHPVRGVGDKVSAHCCSLHVSAPPGTCSCSAILNACFGWVLSYFISPAGSPSWGGVRANVLRQDGNPVENTPLQGFAARMTDRKLLHFCHSFLWHECLILRAWRIFTCLFLGWAVAKIRYT